MLNINTMEILQGPVARSIMQASQTTRTGFEVIFLVILLIAILSCEGDIAGLLVFTSFFTGVLVVATWLLTGYSYKDFKPSSYRTLVVQIDTESEQFKNTFKTTENLDHMIKTFPVTEQQHLDTKIVNKQGKYYFTNTVTKQYVDEVPNKASVKRKMESDLKAYYNKMNIYTQTLVEDEKTTDTTTQGEIKSEAVKQAPVPKKKIIGTEPMLQPKQTKQLDAENSPKPVSFEQWLQH